MRTTIRRLLAVALALGLLAAACGDDSDSSAGGDDGGGGGGEASGTISVPDDYGTIQEAVDAAEPGSLVLIEPGTYEEAVNVTTDDLTIRGMDRNETVLEGNFELENGIRVLEADGVVVENLTAQNYTRNGVFFTGVDGYRASYVNAIRNGDYGVYAFGSVNGQFDNSYASGSPDAGFYIGQCYPCNAVIQNVTSEWNGLGYSGTNAGGDLYIVESTFRENRAGIVPNSGSYEGCAPERETTMVGNLVHDNSNAETSAIDAARLGQGNGILVTGGLDNVIQRNQVYNHEIGGIAIVPFPEDDPVGPIPATPPTDCTEDVVPVSEEEQAELDNPLFWPSTGNQVVENVISDSGEFDIIFVTEPADENCVLDNEATVYSPDGIQEQAQCDGAQGDYEPEFGRFLELVEAEKPESADYAEVDLPDPGSPEGMDDPANAPYEPFRGPGELDLEAIEIPAKP